MSASIRFGRPVVLTLVFALVCLGSLVSTDRAWACSCVGRTSAESFAAAEVVFAGELVDIKKPRFSRSSPAPVTMTFEVSEVFKGTAHATQKVTSAVSSASCGFDGQPGRWLIYAKGSGILATDLCSGNTQDIAAASLSKGSPPTPGKSAGGVLGMRAAAGFGALAGLAMAGAVILLRRRRA